jgi:hypothetical protein
MTREEAKAMARLLRFQAISCRAWQTGGFDRPEEEQTWAVGSYTALRERYESEADMPNSWQQALADARAELAGQ